MFSNRDSSALINVSIKKVKDIRRCTSHFGVDISECHPNRPAKFGLRARKLTHRSDGLKSNDAIRVSNAAHKGGIQLWKLIPGSNSACIPPMMCHMFVQKERWRILCYVDSIVESMKEIHCSSVRSMRVRAFQQPSKTRQSCGSQVSKRLHGELASPAGIGGKPLKLRNSRTGCRTQKLESSGYQSDQVLTSTEDPVHLERKPAPGKFTQKLFPVGGLVAHPFQKERNCISSNMLNGTIGLFPTGAQVWTLPIAAAKCPDLQPITERLPLILRLLRPTRPNQSNDHTDQGAPQQNSNYASLHRHAENMPARIRKQNSLSVSSVVKASGFFLSLPAPLSPLPPVKNPGSRQFWIPFRVFRMFRG